MDIKNLFNKDDAEGGRFGSIANDLKVVWQKQFADGFQWTDLLNLVKASVSVLAPYAIQIATASDAERREMVVGTIQGLYDKVVAPLDIPLLPDWLIDKPLGMLLGILAGWLYDDVLAKGVTDGDS